MAEFCKQCHDELLHAPKDNIYDFAGHVSEAAFLQRGHVAIVLCEGCGAIEVNHLGECVSKDCPKHGEKNAQISNPKTA